MLLIRDSTDISVTSATIEPRRLFSPMVRHRVKPCAALLRFGTSSTLDTCDGSRYRTYKIRTWNRG